MKPKKSDKKRAGKYRNKSKFKSSSSEFQSSSSELKSSSSDLNSSNVKVDALEAKNYSKESNPSENIERSQDLDMLHSSTGLKPGKSLIPSQQVATPKSYFQANILNESLAQSSQETFSDQSRLLLSGFFQFYIRLKNSRY